MYLNVSEVSEKLHIWTNEMDLEQLMKTFSNL